jgi:N-acetylglutamate synthase-like GNAT family acetyltransferase
VKEGWFGMIRQMKDSSDPGFVPMLKIYTEALHSAERKNIASLTTMVERPGYRFLISEEQGRVLGFSISFRLTDSDAVLLEYMAVSNAQRGSGIGRSLFLETMQINNITDCFVLVEVESDDAPGGDNFERARRKHFYRKLGCLQIEGLNYLMPRVSEEEPPPMNMLVCSTVLPRHLKRDRVQGWINSLYVEVYGRPANDPQVLAMFKSLPEDLCLI